MSIEVNEAAVTDLRDWRSTMQEAERRYHEAVRAAFPVGSFVTSLKNGRTRCEVLKHSSERLYVYSNRSGKQYWIDVYHVEEARLQFNEPGYRRST